MRFQKTIKKMIALGTGATMMGATLMSAALAADLADYPNQFIQDGVFNGYLVVGDLAKADDVIGITDVAISLQHASVKAVESATAAVGVEGDAWKVGTSTKILEISEELSTGDNRETLRNITTFIDNTELDALSSGTVSNNKASSPFNQYLYLLGPGAGTVVNTGYVIFTEDDRDVTADFLYFKTGTEIGRYLLEFTTALESDVEDSAGSASSTGLYLGDLEDVELNLFGKKYTIVTARRTSTVGKNAKLILMAGATKATMLEKDSKTFNVNGKDYETTLNFVDADEAQFTVNGALTRKLKDGDTDKLFDGTDDEVTMGVTEILYQDYAGGVHSSTFFIGAQKLELKDTAISDVASSNALKVDDDSIDDAPVIIEGTDDNSTFKITRIHVNMTADDDFYVPAGGKLSENPDLDEPGVIFTNNWDIEYKGLAEQPTEDVEIATSGSKRYKLKFKDGDGNDVSLPLVEAVAASKLELGEKDKTLIQIENRTITKDDYLILSDFSENRGERKTYILQYKGADKKSADSPMLKFKNLGTGETIEQPYDNTTSTTIVTSNQWGQSGAGAAQLATLKIGGADYRVWGAGDVSVNDFDVVVDLDADGTLAGGTFGGSTQGVNKTLNITTYHGLEIGIQNATTVTNGGASNGFIVSFKTPDNGRDGGTTEDNVETLQATDFVVNITSDSNGKVDLAELTGYTSGQNGVRLSLRTPDGETDVAYGYTSYGTFIKHETPTSDPNTITMQVPKKQRETLVYITTKGSTFTTSVAAGEAGVPQRIEVGAVRKSSQVIDVKAQNTILVGGPCANAAAATAMGVPMSFPECAADFKPNVGKIELIEFDNGKIALLVAGLTGDDTYNAASGVLSNYKDYKDQLKGKELEVTKVNEAYVVAAPAVTTTTTTVAAEETA